MTDRELDALVATKVMGWHLESKEFGRKFPNELRPLMTFWWCDDRGMEGRQRREMDWNPSTSIAAAWEVVEHLRSKWGFALIDMGWPQTGWFAEFAGSGRVDAETASRAICLAALQAVGVEVPHE